MHHPADQAVPYPTPESLPAAIRADLPAEAHRVYLDAFAGQVPVQGIARDGS